MRRNNPGLCWGWEGHSFGKRELMSGEGGGGTEMSPREAEKMLDWD